MRIRLNGRHLSHVIYHLTSSLSSRHLSHVYLTSSLSHLSHVIYVPSHLSPHVTSHLSIPPLVFNYQTDACHVLVAQLVAQLVAELVPDHRTDAQVSPCPRLFTFAPSLKPINTHTRSLSFCRADAITEKEAANKRIRQKIEK